MIIAWLASAPYGMLMARYYKQTWISVKPFGKDLWFRVHQVCMGLVVILTFLSFFIMLAVKKGAPFDPEALRINPHAAVGVACVAGAVVQPIMAYFRPHPGAKNRWIFNWAHWLIGNVTFFLAIAAIFLSIDLPGVGLPVWMTVAMIGYVLILAVAHLVLMFQRWHDALKPDELKSPEELNLGGLVRKVVAVIAVIFVWTFCIASCVVILLKIK